MKINLPIAMLQVPTLLFALFQPAPVHCTGDEISELQSSFQTFMGIYIREIKRGNTDYVKTVHPNLPGEMRRLFVGTTIDIMRYAEENGLSPEIACRENEICKIIWPQPRDSWAPQTFVRHNGNWQWLEY